MEFASRKHKKAYEKVRDMMEDLFGKDEITPHENNPGWMVAAGSAVVHVSVVDWRDDLHLVQLVAYVVRGPDLSPSCLRHLLDENHSKAFGGFSVDKDADIAFGHTLIAEHCEKDELKVVVKAVSFTADSMDDTIIQRWGGKRAAD